MQSYYGMGIAAEVRMHQLLDEAEHGRLIRGIESRRDRKTTSPSIRARVAARFQRLAGWVAGTATGQTVVEHYKGA